MQFKHPEILYALFLLLIPIIVHLFQLRKFKKEAFTNVAFLKQVNIQTRKSSQIKKWLTLFTRMLALAAIVLAFAQPYTSKNLKFNEAEETVIYLDNSFSMQKKGANGELLKRAVQELLLNIDENKPFTLITNDDVYKNTTVKASKNDLLQISYSATQLDYNAALLKCNTFFSNKANLKNLVAISDFQVQQTAFQPQTDSLTSLSLVQLKPANTDNIGLDSLYISNRTSNTLELSVTLKKQGFEDQSIPVSLYNNNQLIAKTAVEALNTVVIFSIPANEIINGKITVDDNQLEFDNTLYFNINAEPKINVLAVSDSNDAFLKRLFTENEFNFQVFNSENLDFNLIEKQHCIIVNQIDNLSNALITALKSFEDNGGTVILIPSKDIVNQSYNTLLINNGISLGSVTNTEKRITSINYSHPIYREVFDGKVQNFQYPKAQSFYPVTGNTTNLLEFEDGKPFLFQTQQAYVFTAPLEDSNSNFIHSDLVVTLYAIAKSSLKIPELYYTIGNTNTFDVEATLKQDEILSLSNETENIIPQQRYFNNRVAITTQETPNVAGIYELTNTSETLKRVSYNFNRSENALSYNNLESNNGVSVSNSVKTLLDNLKSDSKINELWKWFVIFALVFLILEILILKYLK